MRLCEKSSRRQRRFDVDIDDILQLRAKDLAPKFSFFGTYYSLKNRSFRSQLEIVDNSLVPLVYNDIKDYQPDAICCMMNPGGSHPTDPGYEPPSISHIKELPNSKEVVPLKPDVAQWQVCKVMMMAGWSHVRVLNLSDLREPKSKLFLEALTEIDPSHSVFDQSRRQELIDLVGKPKAVLIATSKSPQLTHLAKTAESFFREEGIPIVGVKDGEHYRYPSPPLQSHKDQYLRSVYSIINETGISI